MTDAEARARRMGWRPEDEWDESATKNKRRPTRFLTAEEYLVKVENDLPVLRERNRFLDGELAEARTMIAERDDLIIVLHERNKATSAKLRDAERRLFAAEVGHEPTSRPEPAPKTNGHDEAYDGLTDEERADCDRYLRCVPGCTVEDWMMMYRPLPQSGAFAEA